MESKTLSKKKSHQAQDKSPSGMSRKAKKPSYLHRRQKLQAKMQVSDPGDSEEKEADRVADDVKRHLSSGENKAASAARSVGSGSSGISRAEEEEEAQTKLFREEEEEAAQPKLFRAEEEEEAQTKLFREEEEEMAQTKLFREEEEEMAQTKLFREEEEEMTQTKLFREEEEEMAQTKLFREEEEEAAQPKLFRTEKEEEALQASLHRKRLHRKRLQRRTLHRKYLHRQYLSRKEKHQEAESEEARLDQIESRIAQTRGNGQMMDDEIRQKMEQQFGKDFSSVVIHHDMQADELCKELNARAFAIGSDIYFASGEYNPDSERGQELIAHELTHVVQQGRSVTRKIYRSTTAPPRAANPTDRAIQKGATLASDGTLSHPRIGSMNRSNHTIVIPSIDLPAIKKPFTPQPCDIPAGRVRDDTQSSVWDSAVQSGSIGTKLDTLIANAPEMKINDEDAYYLKLRKEQQFIMGTRDQVLDQVIKPRWNESGRFRTYDVDHKREFQLGGADGDINNFWLLESSANRSSGAKINNELNRKIESILDIGRYVWSATQVRSSAINARAGDEITIEGHGGNLPVIGHPGDSYDLNDINNGDHLAGLQVLTARQIRSYNLRGSPTRLAIFSNPAGGRRADIPWGEDVSQVELGGDPGWGFSGRNSAANIQVNQLNYTQSSGTSEGGTGTITGYAYSQNKYIQGQPFSWNIVPMPGVMYGGVIDPGSVQGWVRNKLRAKGFSPVELTDAGLQGGVGLVAGGKIHCDLPLLEGTEIGLNISGENVEVDATIPLENIKLPSPITVSHSSLRVFVGTRGFGAEGNIGLDIENLGTGEFTASMSTEQQFEAEGKLNFDSSLFDRTEIDVWYRNGQFGGSGTVGIDDPEKIKGINSANLSVSYEEGEFSAEGSVNPDIPGIQEAGLSLEYSEKKGLTIGGTLQLAANPGIRSGSIEVEVNKQGETWKVSGEGSAQPAIPGIDSELTVGYEDGGFKAEFSGAFERGMLSGRVTAGVSNRSVGDDGQPSGDPLPDGQLLVYGSGSATVRIAPWLQGSAGIRFDPNGEVTVSGEISIPDELEIFARKEIDKSLFNIAVQAPIVPGIVAEVGGGLSARAGIGPGVIDELRIGIEYNPAHEENTRVTGDAHLKVPADAGLRLSVRAGIGLGITGASATGGLDIGGTLGIEGAAEAGVHIDWTPATGLDLTAQLSVHAQPSFTFDIGGYVSVTAAGFSVYDERFEFASYTFGSDYRFGITMPVHYKEGEPFDISTDDIEFEVPDINTSDLLRGLIARIT